MRRYEIGHAQISKLLYDIVSMYKHRNRCHPVQIPEPQHLLKANTHSVYVALLEEAKIWAMPNCLGRREMSV